MKYLFILLLTYLVFQQFCTRDKVVYKEYSPAVYYRLGNTSHTELRRDTIKYLVIHSTANDSVFADASFHAQYIDTTSRKVSWHYSVDDGAVFKHFPDSLVCYHSSSRLVNRQSIGIELCENKGYNKEIELKLLRVLIRQIRKAHPNIKVIFHDEVPLYDNKVKVRKVCPRTLSKSERKTLLQ